MSNNLHYLNGNWVFADNLKVSAFDLAVSRGFGVFDFLRTYNYQPFYLKEHIDRFFNSAKLLGLKVPKTKKEVEDIVYEGINKNSSSELNIKIILTGGETEDGLTPIGKHSLLVIFTPAISYPEVFYQKGIRVITVKGSRFLPHVKYLNYTQAVIAMNEAKKFNAQEALYVNEEGKITEGTRSNFFAIINNKLITPDKYILNGITREVVLKIAKNLGIEIEKKDIFVSQITQFEEAFLTSSTKEIMPIVAIDDKTVRKGSVGEITKKLMREFKVFVNS